jgi:hypothetical protein
VLTAERTCELPGLGGGGEGWGLMQCMQAIGMGQEKRTHTYENTFVCIFQSCSVSSSCYFLDPFQPGLSR